jgi:hypothetical protein
MEWGKEGLLVSWLNFYKLRTTGADRGAEGGRQAIAKFAFGIPSFQVCKTHMLIFAAKAPDRHADEGGANCALIVSYFVLIPNAANCYKES